MLMLACPDTMLPVSEKKKLQETLTEYVKGNLNRHNTHAIVYLIYVVGNFVMALGQLLFISNKIVDPITCEAIASVN